MGQNCNCCKAEEVDKQDLQSAQENFFHEEKQGKKTVVRIDQLHGSAIEQGNYERQTFEMNFNMEDEQE